MEATYNIEVTDRQSFIRFLELLRQDFLNQAEWENHNLDRFFEAMVAFTSLLLMSPPPANIYLMVLKLH